MTAAIAMHVGAWLLTYALHSTLLLGAAWAITRAPRVEHGVREIVWKVALVGGLVTATLQGALAWRPAGSVSLAPRQVVEVTTTASLASTPELGHEAALAPHDEPDAPASSPATADGSGFAAPSSDVTLRWLAWLWLALAVPLVLVFVGRRLVLTGRIGDRRAVDDRAVLSVLDALRASGEVSAPIHLTASQAISSPVALGASEICLPATALHDLDTEQLRAMLAHELAHLVRRDPTWLVIACVVERALFFQPLNRLAQREILLSAEYLADEWAARRAGGIPLAKALVKVAEWIQASPLGVPVAGFAEERSQLSVRVTRLLDRAAWAAPKSRWRVAMLAVTVVAVMAVVVPGISAAAIESEPSAVGAPAAADAPGVAGWRDTSIVTALIERLRDEDAEVRRATADALGRVLDQRAIAPLVVALRDDDEEVRLAALHALSHFERGVPAPPIRALLASPIADVRATAVQMLGEMRDRASLPDITRLVVDADEDVRSAALEALDEMNAPISEGLVSRVLEDRSPDLRQRGLSIAGERRMETLVPLVISMLEDPSADVREQAAEALTEIKSEAAHRALRNAITHRDARVRRIAVSYLGDEIDR